MITAEEAKRLYDESGAEVSSWLDREASKKIEDAAKSGNRSVFIFLGSVEVWNRARVPTPMQKRYISALIGLGYRVVFSNDGAPYVPQGLADDYGDGPNFQNYGIMIAW